MNSYLNGKWKGEILLVKIEIYHLLTEYIKKVCSSGLNNSSFCLISTFVPRARYKTRMILQENVCLTGFYSLCCLSNCEPHQKQPKSRFNDEKFDSDPDAIVELESSWSLQIRTKV